MSNFGEFRQVGGEKFRNDSTAIGDGTAADNFEGGVTRATPDDGDDAAPPPPIGVIPIIVEGLTNFVTPELEPIRVDPINMLSTSADSPPYC